MFCLRCGREIDESQVFCPRCLDTMKEYPIKPGTAVQLPDRKAPDLPRSAPRRRQASAEEQVAQLKSTVRILLSIVALLSLVLGGTAWLLLRSLWTPELPEPGNLGRNYTAVEPTGD